MSEHVQVDSGPQLKNKLNVATSCILAVVVALATWGVVQFKHPFFTVAEKYGIGMGASNEARLALKTQQARVDGQNAAVIFSIGGGLLSGVLALFANGCCSMPVRLLTAIPWGAIWGSFAGFVGVIAYAAILPKDQLPSATHTGMAQAIVFAMLGAGLGLLFGSFSRKWSQAASSAVIGGLAGAAGAFAFPILIGLIMPNQSTAGFMPATSIVRLLWLGLPFATIGLAVPGMKNRSARHIADKKEGE